MADTNEFQEPDEQDRELTAFVVDHCDRWRDYRNTNYLSLWLEYERIFRGEWSSEDKTRDSERSRIVTPATQQAVETRHAEVMEAIFGQGEFFDIQDDINDVNGSPLDVAKLKAQLMEDFKQDKIRKSIDQIELHTLDPADTWSSWASGHWRDGKASHFGKDHAGQPQELLV